MRFEVFQLIVQVAFQEYIGQGISPFCMLSPEVYCAYLEFCTVHYHSKYKIWTLSHNETKIKVKGETLSECIDNYQSEFWKRIALSRQA